MSGGVCLMPRRRAHRPSLLPGTRNEDRAVAGIFDNPEICRIIGIPTTGGLRNVKRSDKLVPTPPPPPPPPPAQVHRGSGVNACPASRKRGVGSWPCPFPAGRAPRCPRRRPCSIPPDVRRRRAPALRGAGDPASISIDFGFDFQVIVSYPDHRCAMGGCEEGWGLDRAAPVSSAGSHGPSSPSWHGQGSSANGATSPPPWPKRLGGA